MANPLPLLNLGEARAFRALPRCFDRNVAPHLHPYPLPWVFKYCHVLSTIPLRIIPFASDSIRPKHP